MKSLFSSLLNNRIPGQVVVQITDRCNARCPQCGMRVSERFTRTDLKTDHIKKMIDAAAGQGVQAISFTGGEPLLDVDRLVELIDHAGAADIPFIRTGTNGFMFANPDRKGFGRRVSRLVERLAATKLRNFWISIDSAVDGFHENMRGFSQVVAGIEKALPIFHQAGIFPAANLGINRNVGGEHTRSLTPADFSSDKAYFASFYTRYRKAFNQFYQRVLNLGFTMANTCYPMSIDEPECRQGLSAVYAATTAEDIVRFSPREKHVLFTALIGAIREHRSKLRIFSPLCALEALVRQYGGRHGAGSTYGCRGGVDFFFINAGDGNAYPCGYRGNENFGKLWAMNTEQIKPVEDSRACRQCDWECFRDPSELFGPLLEMFSNPAGLVRRLVKYPGILGTWANDLLYYRACELFDGRKSPDYKKLQRFTLNASVEERSETMSLPYEGLNQNLSVS